MTTAQIDKPLLIWTLQRTGGTNLNSYLNQISTHQKLQDEPFNGRREYGHLTKAWKTEKDTAALEAGMQEACGLQKNIKHCVERVPWAISDALLSASVAAGYAHMFLYRQKPLGRILSMEYAERTRSWGPSKVLKEGQDDNAFIEPLDVDALIQHETSANEKLNKVWRKLRKAGAKPIAISFEELYAEDAAQATQSIKTLAKKFDLPTDKAMITTMIDAIRGKGNQGTSDRYARFKGIPELETRLSNLPKLHFA